jgi:patatin-like phospholipase/acyl hydrolase
VARYCILSLDGGGIRGVFTAAILKHLQAETPFLDKIDLFAGTSTGGILALGLAKGVSPDDLVSLYKDNGEAIFTPRNGSPIRKATNGVTRASYTNTALANALEDRFGKSTTLDKLLPRHVLVASFTLDDGNPNQAERTWRAKFFHNFAGSDSDGAERVVDVALSSSAAPTYFPAYDGYVDGGVVANSPSMPALAQALDPDTGKQALSDVRLLSLGTGANHSFLRGAKKVDWGLVQWAKPLIDIFMDGAMGVADYECRRLLKDNYCRLAPVIPGRKQIKLDDWPQIGKMIDFADVIAGAEVFADTVQWVKKNFK